MLNVLQYQAPVVSKIGKYSYLITKINVSPIHTLQEYTNAKKNTIGSDAMKKETFSLKILLIKLRSIQNCAIRLTSVENLEIFR